MNMEESMKGAVQYISAFYQYDSKISIFDAWIFDDRLKDAILNAIEMWYKESLDFDYNNPGIGGLTRNFTQMVWKDSTKLGLGVARTDSR